MYIHNDLLKPFALATERAAFGSSKFIGKKDKIAADQAAVDEMRNQLNKIRMKGKIVIGEGELDEAPMLYINEKVGTNVGDEYDIAVDPLEGTNFVANNLPNALSVLAVTKKGNLLNAPDMYMEKIAIGPSLPKNLVDLDYGIKKNINLLCEAKNTVPERITVCILKRPRHDEIIKELLSMKVNIKFISDGDVSGVISVANPDKKIDMYVGTGGGPEGVLAAAALACLNCQIQTRLVFQNDQEKKRANKMGILNLKKKYNISDMVRGDVIFSATGVTDGDIVKGIRTDSDFFYSETYLLHKSSNTNTILKNKVRK